MVQSAGLLEAHRIHLVARSSTDLLILKQPCASALRLKLTSLALTLISQSRWACLSTRVGRSYPLTSFVPDRALDCLAFLPLCFSTCSCSWNYFVVFCVFVMWQVLFDNLSLESFSHCNPNLNGLVGSMNPTYFRTWIRWSVHFITKHQGHKFTINSINLQTNTIF